VHKQANLQNVLAFSKTVKQSFIVLILLRDQSLAQKKYKSDKLSLYKSQSIN